MKQNTKFPFMTVNIILSVSIFFTILKVENPYLKSFLIILIFAATTYNNHKYRQYLRH
ncbi:hypothetical protein [Guptibacillus spartinae]|uniref:hypothetical protein n=1 Tax=Guptibacillus spartinae TaxID=3025679 RepID=UPI0023600310|nr:hypothetical protein [Pseudalkalibacillus spartinae]